MNNKKKLELCKELVKTQGKCITACKNLGIQPICPNKVLDGFSCNDCSKKGVESSARKYIKKNDITVQKKGDQK